MGTRDIVIEWNKTALKQLVDLPAKIGVCIHEKVGELANYHGGDTLENNVNQTTNHRLQVCQHSVLFCVADRITIFCINEVARYDTTNN